MRSTLAVAIPAKYLTPTAFNPADTMTVAQAQTLMNEIEASGATDIDMHFTGNRGCNLAIYTTAH